MPLVYTVLFPSKSLRACLPAALMLGASLLAPAQGVITTVAGGPASDASRSLNACPPIQAAAPHGTDIYVVSCNVIYKVDALGVWTAVAGTGAFGYSGDGGPALSATLGQRQSISVDGSGNIFIVDHQSTTIREIDAATVHINTVAGNGTAGYSGDGGAATSAQLGGGGLLTVFADASGNVYVADRSNHRVRKFTVAGNINTIAAGSTTIPPTYPATGINPLNAQING